MPPPAALLADVDFSDVVDDVDASLSDCSQVVVPFSALLVVGGFKCWDCDCDCVPRFAPRRPNRRVGVIGILASLEVAESCFVRPFSGVAEVDVLCDLRRPSLRGVDGLRDEVVGEELLGSLPTFFCVSDFGACGGGEDDGCKTGGGIMSSLLGDGRIVSAVALRFDLLPT